MQNTKSPITLVSKGEITVFITLVQNQVFNYNEVPRREEYKQLKTERVERTEKTEKPMGQNYIIMHRKNVNSNDGRMKVKEQLYNDYNIDNKELYSQAKKQNKRPKSSSSNSQGLNKKSMQKKPILFSTIDNRNANALMTQKFTYKDIKGLPTNLLSSPSLSPNKGDISQPVYEVVCDSAPKQKIKYTKQPVSIKHKNDIQNKVFKVYPYQYKNEGYEYQAKLVKKVQVKTDRHKFKLSNDKVIRKDNIMQMVDTNTLNSARDYQSTLTDRSHNTLKWTIKSTRDHEKGSGSKGRIEDFEKLFYQSMNNDKGKIVSQKGVDFSQAKTYRAQPPSHYRTLSKSKSTKHIKNKKSLRGVESKSKKSKRNSPNGSK